MDKQKLIRICDHLIFWPLASAFLLVPLFFLGITIQGMGFEKSFLFYALTAVSFAAFGIKALLNKKVEFKRTRLDFFIFFFLLAVVISSIFSNNKIESIFGFYGSPERGMVSIVFFIAFFFLLLNSVDLRRIKILFWALVSSLSLVTVFVTLQFLGIFILPMQYAHAISFNPIGSLMDLSVFLVVNLPLLVAAVVSIEAKKSKMNLALRAGLWAVFALNLFCLFALNSYIFWPIAILSAVIPLAFHFSGVSRMTKGRLNIYFGKSFILSIIFIVSSLNLINVTLPPEAYISRAASWDIAKQSIKENAIFGSGVGTFSADFLKFKDIGLNGTVLWNSHSENAAGIFFEALATLGLFGAFAVLALLLSVISFSFHSLLKAEDKTMAIAAFSSSIVFILFALIYPLGGTMILCLALNMIFLISLSVVKSDNFKISSYPFATTSQDIHKGIVLMMPVVFGFAYVVFFMSKVFIADAYAFRSVSSGEAEKSVYLMEGAVSMNPYEDFYHVGMAKYHLDLASRKNDGDLKENKNLDLSIGYAKKALAISDSAENNELMALIYENSYGYMDDAFDLARDHYARAMELNPGFPLYDMKLGFLRTIELSDAQSDEEKNKLGDEALDSYGKALAKKNDLSEAYYGKSIVYKKLNNIDKSIEELENALSLDANIEYANELGRAYISRGMQKKTSEDLNRAESIYLQIKSAAPDFFEASYNLAIIYRESGEKDKMDEIVKEMLEAIGNEEDKELIKEEFGAE